MDYELSNNNKRFVNNTILNYPTYFEELSLCVRIVVTVKKYSMLGFCYQRKGRTLPQKRVIPSAGKGA